MPTYQCDFLGEDDQAAKTTILGARDELDALQEALNLMIRVGGFLVTSYGLEAGKSPHTGRLKKVGTLGRVRHRSVSRNSLIRIAPTFLR